MNALTRKILEEVLAATAEPVVVVRVDRPDWPVAHVNSAFESLGGDECRGKPFADVIEALGGREMALEVSETVRSGEETSHPIEAGGREYLLVLRPLEQGRKDAPRFYVGYWRGGSSPAAADSADVHHALLKAKRRIRDLSRDDAVTGLLNAGAFREVFEHDWAVAAREKSLLSLVTFSLDDFDAYVGVFGRHAADSCLRRVGQAIRRSLRRASDVVARPGGAVFVALSHGSEEANVREFAGSIATAVRELGLHHPRSTSGRFVTVSYDVTVADAAGEERDPGSFLDALLDRVTR
ncbi:MAG: GGDEF domain-containing protein [Gammaproteobacteria bacterium]|nr:GGDEF domain-containing protein [Gammaproteobacteria bacterium]MBT8104677.1 GGDEF domain-containing protein [Gammaproteobacteria bacterium]NNF48884.1 GGDEF domain-containing protein [Woeseiaceae bacterium]NNK24691.1 GGDEF domain-containing protein [Woeseiaceae bacterium]NNL62450.1 GGDEF domain-containing protein [Woeseiaceae bacterium]